MARKKQPPIASEDRRVVGALLRDLRRGAGFRSVDAAAGTAGCPASRPTIYAYERGGMTPSLAQFLELAKFYVLKAPAGPDARPQVHQRAAGVAAIARALELPLYHVAAARELMAAMQPDHRRRGAS
jgi:transcriptional regulator with XRE-family HTH domain